MNAIEYKKYHEAFMQNNHGTTSLHVFLCIFFTVQASVYLSKGPTYSSCSQYTYEYTVLVLPMILAHTILAEHILVLNLIMFIILLKQIVQNYTGMQNFYTKNIFLNDKLPLISTLRGLTYIITGLAILAVDFQGFPRYSAKTEGFGYSLMDTGVGLFIAMSGLVHKDICKHSCKTIMKSNIKIITILIFLGVGRFISVKILNYQEHVTEYGVHWNFFFTIAVCKIISTVLLYLSDNVLALSIVTVIFHEFVLAIGLQDWVFSDSPRDSLISANREGLSSCLGYVSIYLFAVHIRQILLNKDVSKYNTFSKLVQTAVILWLLTFWDKVHPTSRTLANAGYCIFINAILTTITAFKYFIMVLCDNQNSFRTPLILSTINSNGLSYFLIANLSTGAINLCIRTLLVSNSVTFVILNVYMIFTLTFVVYLKKFGLKV